MRLKPTALLGIPALCLFFLYHSCGEETPPPSDQMTPEESFDAYFPNLIAKWGNPGGAVAMVKDDRLVSAKGYGVDPGILDVTVRHLLERAGGWDRDANWSRR